MISMKKIVALAAVVCSTLAGVAFAETITIATGEYEPWTGEKTKYGGFVNRVVREAFARKGVQVTYSYVPWKRAEAEVKEGKVQASSFWFPNPDLDKDFVLSEPISNHRELFFHLKSKPLPKWTKLEDLATLTFGVTRGYSYTAELWNMGKNGKLKLDEASADEQNFRKLLSERINVFPMDEVSGWKLLSDEKKFAAGTKDLIAVDARPLKITLGHLRFPKNGPETKILVEKFNAGLADMKKDGTYEKYYDDMFKGIY